MRLRHLRLITVLTVNPEPRWWEGKLIVRGITAAKYLFSEQFSENLRRNFFRKSKKNELMMIV